MTTEGWIFMVGFRIFDVGLLILWLIWFFRLRDDGPDESGEDGGSGGGGSPRGGGDPSGGGGLRLPLGRWSPGGRRRDHRPSRPPRVRRGTEPLPTGVPARVRSPGAPARVHRRA